MPAKDVFHDAVRHALEKEQWIITDDPLFLRFGGVDMYIDLAAEQLMTAEKNGEKSLLKSKVLSVFRQQQNLVPH
nr:element excision factor XisH family protein [Chamaesiphon sp. OTE_20_metabat_361]